MIHFVLLISRQGKVRLTKWYSPYNAKDKARAVREVSATVLARQQKQCNFLEYKDKKIIYKRYASLYFLACVDEEDNELIVLETIHHFVEVRAAAAAAAAAAAPAPISRARARPRRSRRRRRLRRCSTGTLATCASST
jgi:hypothetical protein